MTLAFLTLAFAAALAANAQEAIDVTSHGNAARALIQTQDKVSAGWHPQPSGSMYYANREEELKYYYREEYLPGLCEHHYKKIDWPSDHAGIADNVAYCAKKCFEEYGCIRFSAGAHCDECRVSKAGENAVDTAGQAVAHSLNSAGIADGQCTRTNKETADAHKCGIYRVEFYHAEFKAGCVEHYETIPSVAGTTTDEQGDVHHHHAIAHSEADCAHSCKNTDGCTRFSVNPKSDPLDPEDSRDPLTCRISVCGENNPQNTSCPADLQCVLGTGGNAGSGSYVFSVFR